MHEVAEEICRLAGLADDSEHEARRLLARTRAVADRCALDPRTDLGIGEVHFPEFELSDTGPAPHGRRRAARPLRGGDRLAATAPAPRMRIWKRLDDELETIRTLGYASYFLTVADVTDLIGEMGVRRAARGSGAGSLVNYLLGISGVDPIRHGLLMERFLSPLRASLPDIDVDVESARREEVYRAILDRFGGERCVSRLDDGHLPRPPRGPRRRRRPRHAAGGGRRDRQGVPPRPCPRRPARRCATCPSCGPAGSATARSTASSDWSSGSTGCRATSRCIPAGCCSPT